MLTSRLHQFSFFKSAGTIALLAAAFLAIIQIKALLFGTYLNNPVRTFEVDLSKGGVVEGEFSIEESRSYIIALTLLYADHDDVPKVRALLGDGSSENDGFYTPRKVGTIVRFAVEMWKLDNLDQQPKMIFRNHNLETYNIDSRDDHGVSRNVATVNLDPGRYRLHLESLGSNPEFAGWRTRIEITFEAKIPFFAPRRLTPNGL